MSALYRLRQHHLTTTTLFILDKVLGQRVEIDFQLLSRLSFLTVIILGALLPIQRALFAIIVGVVFVDLFVRDVVSAIAGGWY